VLYDGARRIARREWLLGLWPGLLAAGAIGLVSRLATLALSCRELAADAGGAVLTGRPMALASALCRVSGELARLPRDDLRAASSRDMFHLLPVDELELLCGRGKTATHPSLSVRRGRLERDMYMPPLGAVQDVRWCGVRPRLRHRQVPRTVALGGLERQSEPPRPDCLPTSAVFRGSRESNP
jgi:hypothetical protein